MSEAIENIVLMAALMFAGVGITIAVLCGFIYFVEGWDD